MNAEITTRSNQWEDAVIVTDEDGNVLEAVVTHLPDSEATFHVCTYDNTLGAEETYQELFSCKVDAA